MWLSREAGGEAEGEEERQRSTEQPIEASRSGSRTSISSGARSRTGTGASPEQRERSALPGRSDGGLSPGYGESGGTCAGRGYVRAHALRVHRLSPSHGVSCYFSESLGLVSSSESCELRGSDLRPKKWFCSFLLRAAGPPSCLGALYALGWVCFKSVSPPLPAHTPAAALSSEVR